MIPFFAAIAMGISTGVAATILLYGLQLVTAWREAAPNLIWALAPAGALTGWLYQRFGAELAGGTNFVIAEVTHSARPVPLRLAPLIGITTWLTHLVGGSAGREGSAVQIGGAIAERVALIFNLRGSARRDLLIAGLGAGFAAATGGPLAGAVFGVEVIGGARGRVFLLTLVASGAAFGVTHLLHAPHVHWVGGAPDYAQWGLWPALLGAGAAFGLTARAYVRLEHVFKAAFARLRQPWARAAVGGLLLSLILSAFDLGRYQGLGLDAIVSALSGDAQPFDPWIKLGLTALTLAAGFKGGEFIPLVFIGATLGAYLAGPGLPLAVYGFGAVYGAAAGTPLAAAVMIAELFGWSHLPAALVVGVVAYFFSGPAGLYPARPRDSLKAWVRDRLNLARRPKRVSPNAR